jgi:hypothetical protein
VLHSLSSQTISRQSRFLVLNVATCRRSLEDVDTCLISCPTTNPCKREQRDKLVNDAVVESALTHPSEHGHARLCSGSGEARDDSRLSFALWTLSERLLAAASPRRAHLRSTLYGPCTVSLTATGDEANEAARVIKSEMEQVHKLEVDLPVKISIGAAWGSMLSQS